MFFFSLDVTTYKINPNDKIVFAHWSIFKFGSLLRKPQIHKCYCFIEKICFFQGWFWHGYEVIGLEKIPETGPALLVYYHGALPLDYYYLVAKMVLLKHRVIHSVVDNILFRIPGLTPILNTFCCTPGTKESCAKDLSEGNLLGISPGGIYEASFSDHKRYKARL